MFRTLGTKILDGAPNYFVIENIGQVSSINHFENLLQEMSEYVTKKGIPSVTVVLNEKEALNKNYIDLLGDYDFWQHETQYFYKRDLNSLKESIQVRSIEIKSIENTTTDLFKKIWQEVMTESLNVPSTLSIEKEFEGMKSELGNDYTKSCLVAYYDNNPIGITMPHIEQGTFNEGRLFYFGLVPKYRGKKWGTTLHELSLQFLKSMGATYYIGATGHRNIPMQRIFEANGCRMFEKKIIYRLKRQST
ncbi:GNAT family N-acetyltransferase [Pseudalkalibacillus salsuginis]|uniref:GNAT family N-acetyltransferase n=1 Tax=Pseudalkalibacillus salsuginis TaxID=2910972 RepID=UPI001F1A6559|nr:GNAT family N-acetyltransferase [Pseudalkalibacillus salsuginis]MCF6409542.1 GNAT family N-acetyltransferase [Pseudalkalibacillus salsuginis]